MYSFTNGLLILVAATVIVSAQPAAFEVASIKLADKTAPGGRTVKLECSDGGRFVSAGMPLKQALLWAYDSLPYEISEVPAWFDTWYTYNIEARAAGPVSQDQCKAMVRTLFDDRFQIKLHRESREVPGFELVVAKKGAKLREVTRGAPEIPGRGVRLNGQLVTETTEGRPPVKGWSIAQLVPYVRANPSVSRPVIDRTGLKGIYQFDLDYSYGPSAGAPGFVPAAGQDRPEIFDALEQQLGLKLQPIKAPIEFLVVDRVERPSEN